ncbi:hypothetical protein PHYBLDRAFT_67070 [Phycomyces blakesleeanus NRRL 1555(-)]|uniref:Uncharacterized protein n=1 Tax=Phycomyces blakesleeanus (strain ATCC 8743b / DSM 1359 / FGSC 10004 / NBRC 33097 / NRRL 1555) TaxID=763407 RepID=A0A162ZTR6_PHYB8|nr:hypothetical protein PHYBLDRAFT_67070 [Phycomyces blakesleeanus NRRL 1555(-)]OAD68971.1 hypothetical protein PHYBLDRAFT_67070 [Phycomyces blakesleeanus NRRL 1555(-)]|eukprot:XP_018287011.1 hypothetical protein PHYBLDRAFT_67070 [Phycomyces blakesleeanus NRRL 1555(-)]
MLAHLLFLSFANKKKSGYKVETSQRTRQDKWRKPKVKIKEVRVGYKKSRKEKVKSKSWAETWLDRAEPYWTKPYWTGLGLSVTKSQPFLCRAILSDIVIILITISVSISVGGNTEIRGGVF